MLEVATIAAVLLWYTGCCAVVVVVYVVGGGGMGMAAGLPADTVVWASEKEDTLKDSFRRFSSGAAWSSCSPSGMANKSSATAPSVCLVMPVTSLFPREVSLLFKSEFKQG